MDSSLIKKIAIGTAQIGLPYGVSRPIEFVEDREVEELFDYAESLGVDLVDTSPLYGMSEERLGKLVGKRFNYITKLFWNNDFDSAFRSVSSSLELLQVDKLKALLIHNSDVITLENSEKILYFLSYIKKQGMVEKVGVSVYDESPLRKFDEPELLDIVQLPFNLLDDRFLSYESVRKVRASGGEVHTRSTFLQGLLLMDPTEINPYFRSFQKDLEHFEKLCSQFKMSKLTACLNAPFSNVSVDRIVMGFHNKRQLEEVANEVAKGVTESIPKDMGFTYKNNLKLVDPSRWKLI